MYETWGNPANWTIYQWIAVLILVFVIIAIIFTMQKLLSIIKMSKKQQYKPNLRRLRTDLHSVSHSDDDEDEK